MPETTTYPRRTKQLPSFEFHMVNHRRGVMFIDRNAAWALAKVIQGFGSENPAIEALGRQMWNSSRPEGCLARYDDDNPLGERLAADA